MKVTQKDAVLSVYSILVNLYAEDVNRKKKVIYR